MLHYINLQISITQAIYDKSGSDYFRGKLLAFKQCQSMLEHYGYGLQNAQEARSKAISNKPMV